MVVVILVWASIWGTMYWNRSLALGRHPFFYQLYYEPAVMLACGKGFVVAEPQVPAMTRFLNEQTSEFACREIPRDAKLVSEGLYQGPSRYLMTAVGLTWRLTGVSWQRLGPLAGLMFGVTIAAAYGIFRLGMGRLLAALCAWALSMSTLHLANLPHIRDYSKAPFVLLLVFLLGLVVTRPPTGKTVVMTAAAFGAVLGIGYGFRTDLLISIPLFLLTVFVFLDVRALPRRLALGGAASLVCLATFFAVGWPIISAVRRTWGCQWHTALLGMELDFTRALGLDPAPYDWLGGYGDEFAYATATSFAARVDPGVKHITYCGPDDDRVTSAYMLEVARRAPADFIVRAYASALQMVQLPLRWRNPPMLHSAVGFYRLRGAVTSRTQDAGMFLVLAAAFLLTAATPRLGLYLVSLVLYLGGYPAIQFANRHFFHLEFITWWAFGFLLHMLGTAIIRRARGEPQPSFAPRSFRRAGLALAGCAVGLWAVLAASRVYQQWMLKPLLEQYVGAELDPVATMEGPGHVFRVPPVPAVQTDPETADLIAVDVNEWQCPVEATLTFVYDQARLGFARPVELRGGQPHRPTRVFMPVYGQFQGVSVREASTGCIAGVYRIRHPERFRLMPEVILRPDWADRPLYQRLIGWGIEPPPE